MFLKKAIAKVQRVCGVEKKTGVNLDNQVEEEKPRAPVEEDGTEDNNVEAGGVWLSGDVNRIRDQIENFIEENQTELTYAAGGAGVASLVFILLSLINSRPITKVKPGSQIERIIIGLGREKENLAKDRDNLIQEREELKKVLSSLINQNKKLTKQQMMDAMSKMEEIVDKSKVQVVPELLERSWKEWQLEDKNGKRIDITSLGVSSNGDDSIRVKNGEKLTIRDGKYGYRKIPLLQQGASMSIKNATFTRSLDDKPLLISYPNSTEFTTV